jgi:hypothetical protein
MNDALSTLYAGITVVIGMDAVDVGMLCVGASTSLFFIIQTKRKGQRAANHIRMDDVVAP